LSRKRKRKESNLERFYVHQGLSRNLKRDITSIIAKRLCGERHFIQVITGPRQVGKTTAIRQVLRDMDIPYHYAAADLPAPPLTEWIAQQWDAGRRRLRN